MLFRNAKTTTTKIKVCFYVDILLLMCDNIFCKAYLFFVQEMKTVLKFKWLEIKNLFKYD